MVTVEHLGNGSEVAGEVPLRPLGNTTSTPCNEYILRQAGVGILDLHERELDSTFVEVLDELVQLALCAVKRQLAFPRQPSRSNGEQ